MINGALECFQVLFMRLIGFAVWLWRGGSSGKRAAFRDELSELRFVLPWLYSINNLFNTLAW